ncbi:hypothetical protein ATG98_1254 [Marinobacter sp. LV10R520-4]|uniref:hypothetical protein n=1 Tax=Marinobacter sp. LV10R520-4 TaxID=1761796 RepID=UPI000BF4B2B8|nr:hypothetical protein [Marinobacter sp. LV10R520-4]PFG52246.1 hypothetical protein ATG98_1254 [Marinobacter sp. LV10R520-4]
MNKWIAISFATVAISGCATFNGEQAATMDREQHIAELSQEIETVGFNRVEIQPGVDEFLNLSASLLERQYSVMGEYRTVTANYVDVQGFIEANKKATDEELAAALMAFDAGATSEEGKIGPKIKAYEDAVANISEQNAGLGLEVAANLLKATIILKDNAQIVGIATGVKAAGSLFGGSDKTADNDLGLALLRAKDQLSLAYDANKIISLEQETIEQINEFQEELENKA